MYSRDSSWLSWHHLKSHREHTLGFACKDVGRQVAWGESHLACRVYYSMNWGLRLHKKKKGNWESVFTFLLHNYGPTKCDEKPQNVLADILFPWRWIIPLCWLVLSTTQGTIIWEEIFNWENVPTSLPCGQLVLHFLEITRCRWTQLTVSGAIPGMVGLGTIRKQHEQAVSYKTVSSIPPQPPYQLWLQVSALSDFPYQRSCKS